MNQQANQEFESNMPLDATTLRPSSTRHSQEIHASPRSYSTPILLTVAAIAIVGIFAHTLFSSVRPEIPLAAPPWSPVPEPEIEPEPIEPTEVAAPLPPVRIRNAFDESEVFEFPGGTSKEDARRAVADILKRRALERQ
jgi:hypothetical protein